MRADYKFVMWPETASVTIPGMSIGTLLLALRSGVVFWTIVLLMPAIGCGPRAVVIPGESPSARSSASVSPTESARPSGSPVASAPATQQIVDVLKVATGVGDLPGVSPEQAGGIPARGPLSVAVESGRLYLWDQANLRVLVFDGATFGRKLPLASTRATSVALVFQDDRIYLRDQDDQGTALVEDEFDATNGARLLTARITSFQPSIYPRERLALPVVSNTPKGSGQRLGVDRYGNRYERFVPAADCGGCVEFRRIDAGSVVVARAVGSSGTRYEDVSVSSDGAVYGLAWDRDASNRIVGATVVRVLGPAK